MYVCHYEKLKRYNYYDWQYQYRDAMIDKIIDNRLHLISYNFKIMYVHLSMFIALKSGQYHCQQSRLVRSKHIVHNKEQQTSISEYIYCNILLYVPYAKY